MYVIRAGQEFYFSNKSDLLAFTLTGGFFYSIQSYFQTDTRPGGLAPAIARFEAEVDDATLFTKSQSGSKIDLNDAAPRPFFTALSEGGSQSAKLTTTAIHLTDDVLQLDILSDGGKYTGTFWIDLKAQRLLRSVVDGKEFFKAK